MVDMGDDGEVADVIQFGRHDISLQLSAISVQQKR
jgi:hypothetical protein